MGDQLNPIAKIDESGSIVERYVYGLKSNVPEYIIKGNNKYKIVSNHLGSPVAVWQEGERTSPVLEKKYDSFGNILEENGDFELIFGFAGGIWDKDTKLVRFGVRDYDSETGRWTSKEPLGFAGSSNFYVYAGNDAIGKIDLDGNAYKCRRPLKGLSRIFGSVYHEYICTDKGNCGGFTTRGNPVLGWGDATTKKEDDPSIENTSCVYLEEDTTCMDHCLNQKIDGERPLVYSVLFSNCQHWAQYVHNSCLSQCKGGEKAFEDTFKYLYGENRYGY